MLTDGERLKELLISASDRVVLCAPFIKEGVLRTLFSVIPAHVKVEIYTRWRVSDVVAGVSDLTVFELSNNRQHTNLFILNELHAKLYVADHRCLVGSANLTAPALGWAGDNNLELLVPATIDNAHIKSFYKKLEIALPATFQMKEEVRAEAEKMEKPIFSDGINISEEDSLLRALAWFPKCAVPDKLFEIYSNPNTTYVVAGTKDDGISDISDLGVPPNLSISEFNSYISSALSELSTFSMILSKIPERITDLDGYEIVTNYRKNYSKDDIERQWHIIREWIRVFFVDKFEVAPDSYVIRLKPTNK